MQRFNPGQTLRLYAHTCARMQTQISGVKSSVANRCIESKKMNSHSHFDVPSYRWEVNTLDSESLMFASHHKYFTKGQIPEMTGSHQAIPNTGIWDALSWPVLNHGSP